MTEIPIPPAPLLSDDVRRRRWKTGMTTQLETSRLALVDLPDSEGPESLNAVRRYADDVLADEVHEHAARARKEIRAALEKIRQADDG